MKFDMLHNQDIFNLALQRTESLFNLTFPKSFSPSYFLWYKLGFDVLLKLESIVRRDQIIAISVEKINAEVENICKQLPADKIRSIADIGPGVGIEILSFAKYLNLDHITLIDIEESENKHHGFEAEGAGYNSLKTAEKLIALNIDDDVNIDLFNPNKSDIYSDAFLRSDLIVSLLSCGFHYPVKTYLKLFREKLNDRGFLVLDLRKNKDHSELYEHFKVVATIAETETYYRFVLCRNDS